MKKVGSGALNGKILDLGLLKISLGIFFLFLDPARGFKPAVPDPNTFPNPAGGKANIFYLNWPKTSINFIIFDNP